MIAKISVVIPTYNYGRFVAEAIESALGQTCSPLEVIVVDDGSTDDTETVVRAFGDRVRYIRQENAGVCAARNRGVAESTGELIAFLDADDIWEPEKLERQLARFAEDPEIGLVHCGAREFNTITGETLTLLNDGLEGWVANELLLWERPVIVGPGGAIVVRREAFDDVGGFDPLLKVGEDWDFCYRLAMKYKIGFVPAVLINYRSHSAAAHLNVAEMERGMGLFFEKAFDTDDAAVLALKSRAKGNFHRVLAGSYYHAGNYGASLKHTVLSLWNRPAAIGYFLAFPLRRLRNLRSPAAAPGTDTNG